MTHKSRALPWLCLLALVEGCGGGGGGGSTTPPPTASLSASPVDVAAGASTTLSWSSTNATACTAAGGWSGSKSTTGTEMVGPLSATTTFSLSCSGAGGTSPAETTTVTVAPVVADAALSGRLFVPGLAQADRDTNDILLTPISNSTIQEAQPLPNPVIVGGYANLPGQGPSGPAFTDGDLDDFYSISLVQGQIIELTVANPSPSLDDLDLELYTTDPVLVDASTGIGRVERLVVPASGEYFIRVMVFDGASNYVLTVGNDGSSAAAPPTLRQDFVPGEVIAGLAGPARSTAEGGALRKTQSDLATRYRLSLAGGAAERELLLRLGPDSLAQVGPTSAGGIHKAAAANGATVRRFASDTDRRKWETLQLIKQLSKDPAVAWAEPNHRLYTMLVPIDPLYPRQRWHYELIHLPAAWDITTGSPDVVVAVVDTGVRPHVDLAANLIPGKDFVRGENSGDGDGIDDDASDPGTLQQGAYVFHGTHVAGTIGAATDDLTGVAGVAGHVAILPVRVIGNGGSGSSLDIIQGFRYAAGLANDSGTLPARPADIINLSLGGKFPCTSAWQTAIDAARAAGVAVVASAGNGSVDAGGFSPAGCAGVITVSAVDARRARAPYSNFGSTVDIAAPGGNPAMDQDGDGFPDGVFSTHSTSADGVTFGSTYDYLSGTSMAAPHVSGVLALMKSVNPGLTPMEIDAHLAAGVLTDDIGPPGPDTLGVGLVNAHKAVLAAGGPPSPRPAALSAVASSLNFGDVVSSNQVVVANAGDGDISVTAISTSAPWLSAAPVQVDADGLGTYAIMVDRATLAPGTYSGSVDFTGSTGPPARTNVLMQVTSSTLSPDAGQHYFLLIDPVADVTSYQVEVNARGESVDYGFTAVAPAAYYLLTGTDFDNDGFICDDGEACAAYPVFAASEVIDIAGTLTGFDMTTGYHVEIFEQAAHGALARPPTAAQSSVRKRLAPRVERQ